MNSTVEKRRAVLINTAYVALLLGAFYLFMKFAFWMVAPFVFAFAVGAVLQRPVNAISKKTHLKKSLVSGISVLLILFLLIAMIGLVGARLVTEFKGLVSSLMDHIDELPDFIKGIEDTLLNAAKRLPGGLQTSLSNLITSFTDRLLLTGHNEHEAIAQTQGSGFDFSLLKTPLSGVWSTAKQIPSVFVGFLIFLIASCFITSGYDGIVSFIKRQFPQEKETMFSRTKNIIFSTVKKLLKSYALIMLITFIEMCVGLFALKIFGIYKSGYIVVIAIITAIVDIFPVLGTGTVLIPWAVFSLITGKFGMGIGLIVIYACITVIRQIVEPKIVASNLGIPPIVSIMGMYIGLQLFGVIGIFLMPMIITVAKVLNDEGVIHVWKRKEDCDGGNNANAAEPEVNPEVAPEAQPADGQ